MGILPALQHADLGRVLVDANDVVAVLGEARARDQTRRIPLPTTAIFIRPALRRIQNPKASTAKKRLSIY